ALAARLRAYDAALQSGDARGTAAVPQPRRRPLLHPADAALSRRGAARGGVHDRADEAVRLLPVRAARLRRARRVDGQRRRLAARAGCGPRRPAGVRAGVGRRAAAGARGGGPGSRGGRAARLVPGQRRRAWAWPALAAALAIVPIAGVFTLSRIFYVRGLAL